MLISVTSIMVSCQSKKTEADSAGPLLRVNVERPTVDSIVLYQSYPAYLSSDNSTDVVARVSGYIVGKHFTDGEIVRSGAPLFTIENTPYRAKVNEAEAQLSSAISQNEYNAKHYEAMKKALESDAVSKMDVEQAESSLHQSEASVKSAQAAVTTAKMMLGYCTVTAPFEGRIAAPDYNVGDYVAGEGSPVTLTRLYDDRKVSAVFSVEDDRFMEMTQTAQGSDVDYSHIPVNFGDSISGTYVGKLSYQAPNVQKATGTVELKVAVENPRDELRNGMYALVDLPYKVEPHAVIIKDAAIGTDQLGKYVYIVNDSNKVVYTPIETGQVYRDSLRIVTSGLTPTDRYITRAMIKVRDGMAVDPVESAR